MALIPCQLKRKPRRQNLKADTLNTDVNPPEFRHIIFRAITETYKKETTGRTLYYDTRRVVNRRTAEPNRSFSENNDNFEVRLLISKCGTTYIIEGFISNKHTGIYSLVQSVTRSVPKKKPEDKSSKEQKIFRTVQNIDKNVNMIMTNISSLEQNLNILANKINLIMQQQQQQFQQLQYNYLPNTEPSSYIQHFDTQDVQYTLDHTQN